MWILQMSLSKGWEGADNGPSRMSLLQKLKFVNQTRSLDQ